MTRTDTAAAIFVGLVALMFVQNVAKGTGRQWVAAKFANRPPPGRYGGGTIGGSSGTDMWPKRTDYTDPLPAGLYISPYGAPRDAGKRKHGGIDLAAPEGTPALADAYGTIVRVGDAGRCGKRVAIRHPNGTESIYCHLSGYHVTVGEKVNPGQTVGYIGNSGNASHARPHLHYEIRRNGIPVNPAPLIGR